MSAQHTPVLVEETIHWLAIKPDGLYVDATVGLGGHAIEIVRRLGLGGRFVGLDRDAAALEFARDRLAEFEEKVTLVHARFSQIGEVFAERKLPAADGVLADLGVSSMQLDLPERGFSFRARGPLDMRMDRDWEETASGIVNTVEEKELANLLYQLAEERDSRRIARAIVRARPIRDTEHLATVVAGVRKVRGRQKLHPATKTFLALRIAVNREMEELGQFLSRVPVTLSQGGRWVMLSYHSLEDRPVKQCFQRLAQEGTLKILTKKVIQAGDAEIAANPRARSVKMRVAEKIAPERPAAADDLGMPHGESVEREGVATMSEFYTVKQIDNSRLERPMAPNRIRECTRQVSLAALIAVCALLYAWQHFETIQLRYRLESLRSERAQAAELNQELKLEAAGLRAPERIDVIARRQLGLTAPIPGQVAPMDLPPNAVMAEASPSNIPAAQQ